MTSTETVLAREDEFFAAQSASDVDKLGVIFADDLVFVHTTGIVDGKESYLDGVRSARYAHGGIHRLHGSVLISDDETGALTTSVVDMMITPLGQPHVAIRIFQTIEWSRGGSGWQIRSRHATKQPL